ncbi:MAG TPA: zinc ribbon domain-containing protein [Gemmatirosa sp.]
MAVATGTLALGAGTALALGAALVVLGPLWAEDADAPLAPLPADPSRVALGPAAAAAEGISAVEALREIEFDRATGKLSDDDYAELKAMYTREALAELRAADAGVSITAPDASEVDAADPVEAALAAFRARHASRAAHVHVDPGSCFVCGPRPESDATFCSNCGRYLAAACPACHAPCTREAQRYCEACGTPLAPGEGATAPLAVGAFALETPRGAPPPAMVG